MYVFLYHFCNFLPYNIYYVQLQYFDYERGFVSTDGPETLFCECNFAFMTDFPKNKIFLAVELFISSVSEIEIDPNAMELVEFV